MNKDLEKKELYEAVKILVDADGIQHIHLHQHKLFTLFSVAFQYMLYRSTKEKGAYIIRVEDSHLAEKLAKKSKDLSTRRFVQALLLPRKLKYGPSTFFLDFFHLGTWNQTKDIPNDRIKGAIIIKNTSSKPMNDAFMEEEEEDNPLKNLPDHYYLTSLLEFVPKTITIAYKAEFHDLEKIALPLIKQEEVKTISGVTLSGNLDWEKIDD